MNELKLLGIIEKGECRSSDFKRELNLSTAKEKSEFVKDIISLANSSLEEGYLIIGVDDDGKILGADDVGEEKLQQICSTYINPPIDLELHKIQVNLRSVYTAVIKSTKKPHKVSRDVDKIVRDSVFVRRGSVIFKASPEEIISMSMDDVGSVSSILKSAQTHKKIKNYSSAIELFEKVIYLNPTPNLYVELAEVYLLKLNEGVDVLSKEAKNGLGKAAIHSLQKALHFDLSLNLEIKLRLIRYELCVRDYACDKSSVEVWQEDYNFLSENSTGYDFGKALFLNVLDGKNCSGITEDDLWLSDMNRAIDSGYKEGEAYLLRAICHCCNCNYGLAIKDLEKCVDLRSQSAVIDFYCYKVTVLTYLRRYEEAIATVTEARSKVCENFVDEVGDLEYYWENDVHNVSAVLYYFTSHSWVKDLVKAYPPRELDDAMPNVSSVMKLILE